MNTKLLIVVVALCAIPSFAIAQLDELILGVWEWEWSGCNYGIYVTPETTGNTRQRVFANAESGMQYRSFQNEVLVEQGSYSLDQVIGLGGIVLDVVDIALEGGSTRYFITWIGEYQGPGLHQLYLVGGACTESWIQRGPVPNDSTSWGAVKSLYR